MNLNKKVKLNKDSTIKDLKSFFVNNSLKALEYKNNILIAYLN